MTRSSDDMLLLSVQHHQAQALVYCGRINQVTHTASTLPLRCAAPRAATTSPYLARKQKIPVVRRYFCLEPRAVPYLEGLRHILHHLLRALCGILAELQSDVQ